MDNALRATTGAPRRGRGWPVNRLSYWPTLIGPKPLAEVRQLDVISSAPIQLLDLTDQVSTFSREFGSWHGMVNIFSRHTTAAVRIQEDEPLLLEDLRAFLTRLAPPEAPYAHNDFDVRTEHMHPDERPNGHSHCLHLLLGASTSVPVVDGALQLGTWQRIFLVELDGPRGDRQVQLQFTGVRATCHDRISSWILHVGSATIASHWTTTDASSSVSTTANTGWSFTIRLAGFAVS